MPDDKRGREKQARDADRRQRERDIVAQLERGEETEPPVEETAIDDLEDGLASLAYPATGTAVIEAIGERVVESDDATEPVEALIPDIDAELFDSPADVRLRIRRPTVAAAMKRIVEATDEVSGDRLGASKRTAYEKTLRALKGIDADDDEGVARITDWIVEQTNETGTPPKSRAVRRRAAKFCRENGYEVSNDEWLGI